MENSRRRRRGNSQQENRTFRGMRGAWVLIGVISLLLLGMLAFLLASLGGEEPGVRFPQIGDHWHADYKISICGELEPVFPVTEGGVHTHGAGRIHLHPNQVIESGRNANVGRFMATAGGSITDELIELPGGDTYYTGHLCPNGKEGKVFLKVNGIATKNVASYVPRDEDQLEFGISLD